MCLPWLEVFSRRGGGNVSRRDRGVLVGGGGGGHFASDKGGKVLLASDYAMDWGEETSAEHANMMGLGGSSKGDVESDCVCGQELWIAWELLNIYVELKQPGSQSIDI